MDFSGIGIVGILLLVLVFFALVGFVKGLAKTLMALVTLAASGFAAWWSYNHGPSRLGLYFENVPDFMNIVCAMFSGVLIFYVLYKIFYFIAHPFESEDEEERKKGWNFGFPAGLISLMFAACFVYFCVNRMRTTDELSELKQMMAHGAGSADQRSGWHKTVMDQLNGSALGKWLFRHDPLWDDNKAKLAKLAIIYYQSGPEGLANNPQATAVLTDPEFAEWVVQQADLVKALKDQDPSALWESGILEKALEQPDLLAKVTEVEL